MIGVEALVKLVGLKEKLQDQQKEAEAWLKQGYPPAHREAQRARSVAETAREKSSETAATAERNAEQRTARAKAKP